MNRFNKLNRSLEILLEGDFVWAPLFVVPGRSEYHRIPLSEKCNSEIDLCGNGADDSSEF